MKRFTIVMTAIGLLLLTTGCNTMRGVGQDMQEGGESIERGAE